MNSTFEFHEMELRMPSISVYVTRYGKILLSHRKSYNAQTKMKMFRSETTRIFKACWIAHSILLIDMCTRR
jgi:hypothetical protein